MQYLLDMNFKSIKSLPVLSRIPKFYQHVFVAFNKVKFVKLTDLNDHELLQQLLFGNDIFKLNGECLYYKNWMKSNVTHVKDLIVNNGDIITNNDLYRRISPKHNLLAEIFTIKKLLLNT